jgi:large subunit ribosomal protein L35
MAYKFKPNKSMASRFKVSKKGKLKRHHAKTSHLMSARSPKTKRRLSRPGIVYEGLARNIRRAMGVSHLNPIRHEHEQKLRAAELAKTGGEVKTA